MTLELSKSIRWSNDHGCFAMFELLAHVFTFLISSFLQVSKQNNTEVNHVTDALRVNNYPSYVISNILKRKFSKPPKHAIPTPFLNRLHLMRILTVLLFFLSSMVLRYHLQEFFKSTTSKL